MPKANATETCPGCNNKFSPSGLSHHLSQTKKPSCIAIRQSHPELAGGLTPQFLKLDFDAPPVQFQGDYYGDYSAQDFDDPMDPSPPPSPCFSGSDSTSESENEYSAEIERNTWEPQPRDTPSVAIPQIPNTSQRPPHLEGPPIPASAERNAAERAARRKTFVVQFKTSTAGAPIPADELNQGQATSQASYKMYAEQVGKGANDNPYHPFATCMEWEVARWAKLRGSGSTAFSDLLAIEGVRDVHA